MAAALPLSLRQVRLSWLARQGLAGAPADPSPAAVVAAVGWVPMASGAAPYLALHARGALARRRDLDDLVARGELVVAPGPRGMTWLVPAADAPLARAFAVADHTSREARVASSCELTARDLQATRDALRKALAAPATPAELRAALGPDALRPLGGAGRRAGVTTLAGLVLRGMWAQGEVSRAPLDGRLERERVRYAIEAHPRVVPSAAEAVDLIAPRWLAAHAPAGARDFALAFSIAAGRAAAALKRLNPVEVAVEGFDEPLLAPPEFAPPEAPPGGPLAALLPAQDPLPDARPRLAGLATPEVARAVEVRNVGLGPVALVDGGVAAAWSWGDGSVTLRPLVALAAEARERLDERAAALGDFIVRELGGVAPLHGAKPPRGAPMLPGDLTSEQ